MLLAYAMNMQRDAKLFRNGRNQAVRIPRGVELPGKDIVITKEDNRLIVEPKEKERTNLLEWLATLEPIEDEFPEIPDPRPEPVDL
jgi:antitoxin VapB